MDPKDKHDSGVEHDGSLDAARERKRGLPRGVYVFARLLALVLLLASTVFYFWGRNMSGRLVFMQSISAEDATRGVEFGPVWLTSKTRYLSRLAVEIPESGAFWETTFAVLDSNKAEVGKETVYLATTEPEFAAGKRTVRYNPFVLNGYSGWYYFRFQQASGTYPRPGLSGPPVAAFDLREGVANPAACFGALLLGWIFGILFLIWPR